MLEVSDPGGWGEDAEGGHEALGPEQKVVPGGGRRGVEDVVDFDFIFNLSPIPRCGLGPRDLNHARRGLVHGEPSQALMLEAREAVRELRGTQHQRPCLARVPDACYGVAAELAYSDYAYAPLFLRY